MRILGIETSCDETALALVEATGGINPSTSSGPKFKILENLVASQIKIHRPFGGVVPNLAKREHLKNLPLLWQKLTAKSHKLKADLIAVTVGPGLEPALWTGITFAKELRKSLINANDNADKRGYKTIRENQRVNPRLRKCFGGQARKSAQPQLVGANHLEGHLYSFLLSQKSRITYHISRINNVFPAIALIASGGHTILLKMESLAKWKKLGETRDDAAGEAFDKVARMLRLPYPGGPEIEKIAHKGNPAAINFPRPMIHDKNYDFSFSGLKTSVLYFLRDNPKANRADVAASFQQAAIDALVTKTVRAAKEFGAKSVMLSGGVAANKCLRKILKKESQKLGLKFFVPDFKYNVDNAVMIAVAGYMSHLRKKKYKLAAQGNLGI